MIEGNRPWWRAALATASLWGCAGSVVNTPPDAAVSDVGAIDTPPVVDTPVVDTRVVDTPPAIDTPPVVDTPPAVDTPLTCDAGTTLCAAACVDTATDVAHCGACNHACESTWSCVRGTCACAAGQHLVGTACVADDAPRPLAPVSLGDVTQRRPTLRWALPPGVDGAVVELCRDRACTMVIETLRVTGTSARPTADLPARSTVFWRMRGRAGSVERTGASPTWIFHVPAMSASTAVDTSFNPHFDINGDGFDDVIVGAREARAAVAGRVATASVFYGSATWTQPPAGTARMPDRIYEGGPAGGTDFNTDNFTLASAGDVNGDGYADLVIGTAAAEPGGRHAAGAASVFYGSATWTRPAAGSARTADRLFEGAVADDRFGFVVAGAGDVNGDGYADLAVATRGAERGGRPFSDMTSVFYGSATWIQPAAGTARIPDRFLESTEGGNSFGGKLAGGGDVNGDGYADLLVWSRVAVPGGLGTASATNVIYGSATWTQPAAGTARTPDRILQGEPGDITNISLASAGDVNGDGYADVVFGSGYAAPDGVRRVGKASVFYGSATWTQPALGTPLTPDRLFEGALVGDIFGTSVASAGDVNGDGYADLVVGAPSARTASVYYGSATWTQPAPGTARTPDRLHLAAPASYGFAWSVAGAGDVNGDGYADLVVGAFDTSPGGREDAGVANVFYGSATWTRPAAGAAHIPDRLFEGAAAGDWFGMVVASADDVDRDGTADLLVGPILASPAARVFSRLPLPPDRLLAVWRLRATSPFARAASARRAAAPHPWCPLARTTALALPPTPHA